MARDDGFLGGEYWNDTRAPSHRPAASRRRNKVAHGMRFFLLLNNHNMCHPFRLIPMTSGGPSAFFFLLTMVRPLVVQRVTDRKPFVRDCFDCERGVITSDEALSTQTVSCFLAVVDVKSTINCWKK